MSDPEDGWDIRSYKVPVEDPPENSQSYIACIGLIVCAVFWTFTILFILRACQ